MLCVGYRILWFFAKSNSVPWKPYEAWTEEFQIIWQCLYFAIWFFTIVHIPDDVILLDNIYKSCMSWSQLKPCLRFHLSDMFLSQVRNLGHHNHLNWCYIPTFIFTSIRWHSFLLCSSMTSPACRDSTVFQLIKFKMHHFLYSLIYQRAIPGWSDKNYAKMSDI